MKKFKRNYKSEIWIPISKENRSVLTFYSTKVAEFYILFLKRPFHLKKGKKL